MSDWGLLLGHSPIVNDTVNGVANGEWWRIITGGFLHAGLLHIGMNMLVLWLIGAQLERAIGPIRFACIYLTSLIAGSLGVLLIDPTAPTVGVLWRRVRLDGRGGDLPAIVRHRRVAFRARHADRAQPRHHVPGPWHLEGRSRGRADRRRGSPVC